jgi:hypothetical protein
VPTSFSINDLGPTTVFRRLGLDWCPEHLSPLSICHCKASNNWGRHDAMRRYTGLMAKGRAHPFREAGGPIIGVTESAEALQQALNDAKVERISLDTLVATQPVTPQHMAQVIRGQAPPPRSGNHVFEASDFSTVVPVGDRLVIADGHHRLSSAWAQNEGRTKARVVRGITPQFKNDYMGLLLKP